MSPALVLGSASPRRAEILRLLGLQFAVRPPEVPEDVGGTEDPGPAALRLAREKVAAVPRADGELVLAADTLVSLDGRPLGKPGGPEEAVRMLERLQGRAHVVHTGIALASGADVEGAVAATRVWFRSLARPECEEYVATREPLDKAGSYGIQGFGAALVERIDGDFFNVMGLPVQHFLRLLERFGLRYAFGSLVPR